MTFTETLTAALLAAAQAEYPTVANWEWRIPRIAAAAAESVCLQAFLAAPGTVEWCESGAAQLATAGPVAEPSGGSDVPDVTQLPLLYAESSGP